MSKMKRYFTLALCLLLAFSLMLTACGNKSNEDTDSGKTNQPTDPGKPTDPVTDPNADKASYKVTVVDGLGNAYTEKIIVKFLQNGKQVAMGAINAEGSVEKTLPLGEYEVEIANTNSELECHYDAVKLTADATQAKVVMAYASTTFDSITAPSVALGDSILFEAADVAAGSSYVKLDAEDRVYVLFAPTQAGTYEFSVCNDDASLGYYGSTNFVQGNNLAEMNGNTFTMSITGDMIGSGNTGTSVLVIGLDAKEGKDGCILNIKRIGDPAWTVEQEPWINYNPKAEVKDFTLGAGIELIPFDVTATTDTYKLVLNTNDGTYHLGTADGPKVYVQLGNAVYGISMKEMVGEIVYDADGVFIATGTAPFRYMYNNGREDFFKEDYTDFMRQVVTAADKATGVYPLTEDLYYVLPMGIDNKGWCREGTVNYLFNAVDVNPEIAWMFMLCYAEGNVPTPGPGETTKPDPDDKPDDPTPTGPIEDNKDEPVIIGGTLEFTADVKANHLVYFDLMKVNDTTLTIKNKNAYVIYNGVKYEAKNGVVSVPNLYSQYTNMPVSIQIGNNGTEDAVFDVVLSYPAGHLMNPKTMPLGAFSEDMKKNNDQGVYYKWVPTQAGTLTLTLDKVTSKSGDVQAGISVTVTGADLIPHQYLLSEVEGNTLTIAVKAGDSVVIIIGVLPNDQNKYLAATIDITAAFA